MKLCKPAAAGTVESGDIQIAVEPAAALVIELKSTVMGLYGRQIRTVIEQTAAQCGVEGARIVADDKGALDCTVRARVRTALLRAAGSEDFGWTSK